MFTLAYVLKMLYNINTAVQKKGEFDEQSKSLNDRR